MDRAIVYDGELPQTTDILNTNKFAMVAEAFQNSSILGASTVIAGLNVTPTLPTATLAVVVAPGAIYQMDPTDQTAYGDLGTDVNNILKQGIVQATQTLAITPPSTAGFSQNYLVQAILNDVDGGAQVVNYYNSTNPADPFSGPANAGTSNFTVRSCACVIALKAGTPAATGSQVTPSPDPGYVGLYTIVVTNGMTQITSSAIFQWSSAGFFPTLPSVPSHILKGDWVWGTDTGAANAYVVTVLPPPQITGGNMANTGFRTGMPVAYQPGFNLTFKASNANSGASTINVNGLGVVGIKRAGGAALNSGDILSGQVVALFYDGTNFQMANYLGISAGSTTNNFTTTSIPYVPDTGAANALIGNYSPAITSGQQIAGLFISIKLAHDITGACTINVNGLGLKNVDLGYQLGTPLANMFSANEVLLLVYDGTEYQIVTTGGSGGATGPAGATGPTGPAGGIPSPGSIGSLAIGVFSANTFKPGWPFFASQDPSDTGGFYPGALNNNKTGTVSGAGGSTSNSYAGTWEVVSWVPPNMNISAGAFSGDPGIVALCQRVS